MGCVRGQRCGRACVEDRSHSVQPRKGRLSSRAARGPGPVAAGGEDALGVMRGTERKTKANVHLKGE